LIASLGWIIAIRGIHRRGAGCKQFLEEDTSDHILLENWDFG